MMAQFQREDGSYNLRLMTDGAGRFYLPTYGFNNIPFWDLTRGYRLAVEETVEAVWRGLPIPYNREIPINDGWNIIAYLPTYELDARAPDFYVLSPILDYVFIAKDEDGNFMLPSRRFSNMPPWRPGKGYQVNVTDNVTFQYPAQPEEGAAAVNRSEPEHWSSVVHTGRNMSVIVEMKNWSPEEIGEIAAVSISDNIVGAGRIADGIFGLAVWGDDQTTETRDGLLDGEAFRLVYWNEEDNTESDLVVTAFTIGSALIYTDNSVVAVQARVEAVLPDTPYLSEGYPNPFNGAVSFKYGLPESASGRINITVIDISGRVVSELVSGSKPAGQHCLTWRANELTAGIYLVRMKAAGFTATRKVVMVK
jgi:hypothetical protein